MKTSRRKFLHQAACSSCMMVAGSSLLFLDSCASGNTLTYDTNTFKVPTTEFATTNNVVVKHKNVGRVLVRKNSDNSYDAISMVCTHKGGKIYSKDGGFKCSLHGSTFDNSGKRLAGKAEKNLPTYSTSVDGDNIVITVS